MKKMLFYAGVVSSAILLSGCFSSKKGGGHGDSASSGINYPNCAGYQPTQWVNDTFTNRLQLLIASPNGKYGATTFAMHGANTITNWFFDWTGDLSVAGCYITKSTYEGNEVVVGPIINTIQNLQLTQQVVSNFNQTYKYTYASSGALSKVTINDGACFDLTYDQYSRISQFDIAENCAYNSIDSRMTFTYASASDTNPSNVSSYFKTDGSYSITTSVDMKYTETDGVLTEITGEETDYLGAAEFKQSQKAKQLGRSLSKAYGNFGKTRNAVGDNTQTYDFTMKFEYTNNVLDKVIYESPGSEGTLPDYEEFRFSDTGSGYEYKNDQVIFDTTVKVVGIQVLSSDFVQTVMGQKFIYDGRFSVHPSE